MFLPIVNYKNIPGVRRYWSTEETSSENIEDGDDGSQELIILQRNNSGFHEIQSSLINETLGTFQNIKSLSLIDGFLKIDEPLDESFNRLLELKLIFPIYTSESNEINMEFPVLKNLQSFTIVGPS
jgi:hypothetical protein